MQHNSTYEHHGVGVFVFDHTLNLWVITLQWLGKEIALSLESENFLIPNDVQIQTLTHLWDNQEIWNTRILDYAVEELLETKNDYWLDEDDNGVEDPLSPNEFKSRITLETIYIDTKGEFEFWHNDGDLFFGHYVWVVGDIRNGLTRADIPG